MPTYAILRYAADRNDIMLCNGPVTKSLRQDQKRVGEHCLQFGFTFKPGVCQCKGQVPHIIQFYDLKQLAGMDQQVMTRAVCGGCGFSLDYGGLIYAEDLIRRYLSKIEVCAAYLVSAMTLEPIWKLREVSSGSSRYSTCVELKGDDLIRSHYPGAAIIHD